MAIKHVRIANVDYDVNDARIEAIDSALSTQSDNPVKNRAVAGEFAQVSYVGDTLEEVGTIPDEEPDVPIPVPSGGGEENVINAITFNGTAVPVTDKVAAISASIPTESTVSGWGFTKNTGTVTQVKVGTTAYNPSSGIVSLPAYPTSLPASDVSAWAKASSKPTYTASEVGAQKAITVSSSEPTSSQGSDGDIWIVI